MAVYFTTLFVPQTGLVGRRVINWKGFDKMRSLADPGTVQAFA
jgi:hypothetical protein